MKELAVTILVLCGIGVLIVGGVTAGSALGTYLYLDGHGQYGATTARTTVTNPWTFSAATTTTNNLVVTTSNSATSTVIVGCIQFYATSTATAQRFMASTTPGVMYSAYGKCPRI